MAARRNDAAAPRVAGWLGLAATPCFAAMALLTSMSGTDADMICSAVHGGSPLRCGGAQGGRLAWPCRHAVLRRHGAPDQHVRHGRGHDLLGGAWRLAAG